MKCFEDLSAHPQSQSDDGRLLDTDYTEEKVILITEHSNHLCLLCSKILHQLLNVDVIGGFTWCPGNMI